LIAIAGGSGSGKTWLARRLRRRLGSRAAVLSLDDFYRDLSHLPPRQRAKVNFDSPRALEWPLFAARLAAIRRGEPVSLPRYDFATHTRLARARRWRVRPLVLVEGLWPWWRRELQRLYSLKVFRTGSACLHLARRLDRDVRCRQRSARSVQRQWATQVEPCYRRYVQPQQRSADLTLPATISAAELDGLVRRLRELASIAP